MVSDAEACWGRPTADGWTPEAIAYATGCTALLDAFAGSAAAASSKPAPAATLGKEEELLLLAAAASSKDGGCGDGDGRDEAADEALRALLLAEERQLGLRPRSAGALAAATVTLLAVLAAHVCLG